MRLPPLFLEAGLVTAVAPTNVVAISDGTLGRTLLATGSVGNWKPLPRVPVEALATAVLAVGARLSVKFGRVRLVGSGTRVPRFLGGSLLKCRRNRVLRNSSARV